MHRMLLFEPWALRNLQSLVVSDGHSYCVGGDDRCKFRSFGALESEAEMGYQIYGKV